MMQVANSRLVGFTLILSCLCTCLGTPVAGQGTEFSFANTGIDPPYISYGVGVGDFNEDGNPDLAVSTGQGVAIYLGNGDGTFQNGSGTWGFATYSASVAVADFNGDGHIDFAVAGNSYPTVSVLLGNGDATFQTATYAVGMAPASVVSGDFNGDGFPDLAISNTRDSTISVLRGKGDGTFATAVAYPTGNNPLGEAVGDLNGDAVLDIVVANYGGESVSVFLGNGDGTFRAAVNYGIGRAPYFVAIGDFNGDGKPDFVTSAGTLSLGRGDGAFEKRVSLGFYLNGLMTGDFNGDGILDIAGPSGGYSGVVSVFLGIGNGALVQAGTYSSENTAFGTVADLNHDSFPELIVTGYYTIQVLLNVSHSPAASLSTTSLDFGNVQVGTTSPPQQITLTNTGYSALYISALSVSGDFLQKNTYGAGLAIGASCTFTIQFRPRQKGLRTGKLAITDDANPPHQFARLQGTGVQ